MQRGCAALGEDECLPRGELLRRWRCARERKAVAGAKLLVNVYGGTSGNGDAWHGACAVGAFEGGLEGANGDRYLRCIGVKGGAVIRGVISHAWSVLMSDEYSTNASITHGDSKLLVADADGALKVYRNTALLSESVLPEVCAAPD